MPKNPLAARAVELAGSKAQRLALATNPVFPLLATETRMRWNGVSPESFCCITSYETSGACKPNPVYFHELLEKIGCRPQECLMVGNDVDEDMSAANLGMSVYLVTDCMINRNNKDISAYDHGTMEELVAYLQRL